MLYQYDANKDKLVKANKSRTFLKSIALFTGSSDAQLRKMLSEKEAMLKNMVEKNIHTVEDVMTTFAKYYTEKKN